MGGRPHALYFEHFEPVDKEKHADDAIDLLGYSVRLLLDNALMACKMCKDEQDRFICKHNLPPSSGTICSRRTEASRNGLTGGMLT
jgi:hypothetical protein